MKHDKIQTKLLLWLDGDLAPAEADEVRRHIAECPDCAARSAALAVAWGVAKRSPRVKPDSGLRARILAEVERAERPQGWLAVWLAAIAQVRFQAATAAAVLLCVGLGVYLGSVPNVSQTSTRPAGGSSAIGNLDSFRDFPPESVGGVFVQLSGTTR